VDLTRAALSGDRRAMARLITIIEDDRAEAGAILAELYPHTGRAHVIGVTGAPGSGKSTLVNELAKAYRAADHRVGVVAVDATSPFSGGAVLGDRVRMRDLIHDAGVFVRSMASRGNLGGLARTTPGVVRVLDAAGFDTIIVETVGTGQLEVEIAQLAHSVVVVEIPGTGDDIQSIKAGILEIADVFAVNKADHAGAARTAAILDAMLGLGTGSYGSAVAGSPGNGRSPRSQETGYLASACQWPAADERAPQTANTPWRPPVVKTVAVRGEGVPELVQALARHRQHLETTGEGEQRTRARLITEVERELRHHLLARLVAGLDQHCLVDVLSAVMARRIDPHGAAERLLDGGIVAS
jgi:LAO/AO transport system kinase